MNQILIWPLTETIKIIFSSARCDLGTITCCDVLEIIFHYQNSTSVIAHEVSGCGLTQLKEMLQQLVLGQTTQGQFQDTFFVSRDQSDNVLVDIRQKGAVFCYQLVSVAMVQSWIAQLDLLTVLMEENEKEKKSRGKGCC